MVLHCKATWVGADPPPAPLHQIDDLQTHPERLLDSPAFNQIVLSQV
jgi:hypothetical protein